MIDNRMQREVYEYTHTLKELNDSLEVILENEKRDHDELMALLEQWRKIRSGE